MKKFRTATLALLLALSGMATTSLSNGKDSGPEAKRLLERSIAAMGGLDKLRSIESISYKGIAHTFIYRVELSESLPQVILYEDHEVLMQPGSLNLSERTVLRTTESEAQSETRLTITPRGGFIGVDTKKAAVPAGTFYGAIDTLAANPISALLSANASSDPRLQRDSQGVYEISFNRTIYSVPVKTLIGVSDQPPYLPLWIEIEHSYSQDVFNAFWGPLAQRFVFSNWSVDPSGIRLPLKWQVLSQGRVDGQMSLFGVKVNPALPADAFEIPNEYQKSFEPLLSLSSEDLAKRNHGDGHLDVADGIVMLPGKQGAYNSIVVKQKAGVVVIEGPYSNANSAYIIQFAQKAFPGQPITGVISTNHLQFHLAGLPAYAKRGIPIYALDTNAQLVRDFLTTQTSEDRLGGVAPKIRSIGSATSIGSGSNRMVLIPFRGSATSRMMAVYFPERKLLYSSDAYLPQSWGGQTWTEHLLEIRDLIQREHLDVEQVLGTSMAPRPWKELLALIPAVTTDS